MFIHRITLLTLLAALLGAGACGKQAETPAPAAAPSAKAAAAATTEQPAEAKAAVARIVVIDLEECCDCTRKRIDGALDALAEALGSRELPVEQIHTDTQADAAAPYREMKAYITVPALYFLDADGKLVEQIQGEVTVEQIRAIVDAG